VQVAHPIGLELVEPFGAHPLGVGQALQLDRRTKGNGAGPLMCTAATESGAIMPSIPDTPEPMSPPCAPYLWYPSRRINSANALVTRKRFPHPVSWTGVENPKPGSEGATTWKASLGSPPCERGSVSAPMTFTNSTIDPG
jgi:hypothetical protein